jgi:hypothetical protein
VPAGGFGTAPSFAHIWMDNVTCSGFETIERQRRLQMYRDKIQCSSNHVLLVHRLHIYACSYIINNSKKKKEKKKQL